MKHLFSSKLAASETEVYQIDSLDELQNIASTLWICDTNTSYLVPAHVDKVVLASGEKHKTWSSVEAIVQHALEANIGRDATFIAVGGGVVCDVSAFAASIYMRGCNLILIPTTLLAMVDASIGGKSGIDLDNSKNIVGSFYPANTLYLSIKSLLTLPEREYKSGLAEVIKHALLTKDGNFAQFLEEKHPLIVSRDENTVTKMVIDSLLIKNSYIEADPFEKRGIRQALNIGHTFAHALESVGNMELYTHGEAVAWGVMRALKASRLLNLISDEIVDRFRDLFLLYNFELEYDIENKEEFYQFIQRDKKRKGAQVLFTLLKGFGEITLLPLEKEVILSLLEF